MDRGWVRTGLQGSALVGMLARLALLEGPATKPSLVDGLGRWLGWSDAIPLAAALNTAAGARTRLTGPGTAALVREFARVRAALEQAIADDGTRAEPVRRSRPQGPAEAVPVAADGDFAPHRRRYGQLQQAMEAAIAPLRTRLREALAQAAPPLGRLAALDAVMEQALGAREQALLAMMPSLLQRHFERQLQAGAGLGGFRQDMQHLLQAELEHRLQPALGLLEALQGMQQGTHE